MAWYPILFHYFTVKHKSVHVREVTFYSPSSAGNSERKIKIQLMTSTCIYTYIYIYIYIYIYMLEKCALWFLYENLVIARHLPHLSPHLIYCCKQMIYQTYCCHCFPTILPVPPAIKCHVTAKRFYVSIRILNSVTILPYCYNYRLYRHWEMWYPIFHVQSTVTVS